MTPEEKTEFSKFMILTIPTLRQEGDTILENLNMQIKFIKRAGFHFQLYGRGGGE